MTFFSTIAVLLVPTLAVAFSFDVTNLPYSDSPTDLETQIALDLLTDLEVIQGNADGTFSADREINRAEFVTIVMRLHGGGMEEVFVRCFPDVSTAIWYAGSVCQAKEDGIVEGEGGYFSPERSINYVEALKVLIELFDVPTIQIQGDTWYDPYVRVADKEGLLLFDVADPAYRISRGQMTRLTAAFVAHNEGELEEFRAAQKGTIVESSSSAPTEGCSDCAISSLSSQSSFSFSSSQSSSSSYAKSTIYDTYGDTSTSQNLLQLGEVSPVLASVKIFSTAQPINLTDITITLDTSVQSIDSLLVFDENKRLLGRASLTSGSTYSLSVHTQHVQIPKQENFTIYVRAQIKEFNSGGISGETFTVSNIGIVGDGAYNNKSQSQNSTDTFPAFQTTRSHIISIENADSSDGVLVSGPGQEIGAFRFTGETGDGQADLAVTDIDFQIGAVGGVALSNVELGADGTSERMSCTVVSSVITCGSIDPQFGSFEDRARVLTLFADVTVPSTTQNTGLQISINQAGSPTSAGSLTWTDGSTSFTWVPLENPVARGTYFQ